MRKNNRVLRYLKNTDRQRLIRAEIVQPSNNDSVARKRLEKLWEESMDFFKQSDGKDVEDDR